VLQRLGCSCGKVEVRGECVSNTLNCTSYHSYKFVCSYLVVPDNVQYDPTRVYTDVNFLPSSLKSAPVTLMLTDVGVDGKF
jgi:hypothetical protein